MSELELIATKTRAKIITVCETWFDDSVTDNEVNIPNYSVIRKDRKRDGGGVCIYIHSDLAFNPRLDLDIPKMEAIWTEILLPRCKPIIVGSCYRPKIIQISPSIWKLSCPNYLLTQKWLFWVIWTCVLYVKTMCIKRMPICFVWMDLNNLSIPQLESHQPLNHLLIILFVIMTIRSANMVLLQVGLVIFFLLVAPGSQQRLFMTSINVSM